LVGKAKLYGEIQLYQHAIRYHYYELIIY